MRLLQIAILCFICCSVKAQEGSYIFRHIDATNGLLNNEVISITQDTKGFMWLVCPNGLQRYDGSRFLYYPDMLSDPSEGYTYGAEIAADQQTNTIWVAKNKSLEKIDQGTHRISFYKNEMMKDAGKTLMYKAMGKEWYINEHAAAVKLNDGKIVPAKINSLPANATMGTNILTDTINHFRWFTVEEQLFLIDNNNNFYCSRTDTLRHPLLKWVSHHTNSNFRFLMMDSKQNIWLSTWSEMFYKYDAVTKQVTTWRLTDIRKRQKNPKESNGSLLINAMMEDDHHTIWIGTENTGLLRFNEATNDFDYITSSEKEDESLRYNYKVYCLFQDREKNIWVGTDRGINIFNPYNQYFTATRHKEGDAKTISNSEILGFLQASNGDNLVATWGGGVTIFDKNFNYKKTLTFAGDKDKNLTWCLVQKDDSTVWIGAQHGHFDTYNIYTGASTTDHPAIFDNSTIRCFYKNNNGDIFIGLHNGRMVKWDAVTKGFTKSTDQPDVAKAILNIHVDDKQRGWASTEDGFKQFDPVQLKFTHIWQPEKNNTNGFWGRSCRGIMEYDDSTLYIGTIYGGVNILNRNTGHFTHLTTADGLSSNNVFAFKKDKAGNVWFTTDYILYKWNPADKKLASYSITKGFLNSSFYTKDFYELNDGNWLIFTLTELLRFSPSQLEQQDKSVTPVEITGFSLYDKPMAVDSILFYKKPLQLSYKENFFTIEFASLNFSNLQQTQYYYKLEGIDKDWVNGGNKQFASYTAVPPGTYTFYVRAANDSNNKVTTLQLVITPPFWKTWWFITVCLLVVGFTTYYLVKRRIQVIQREARMKQQIAETEMMALRAQMNPHFIFNCLNSIDNLIQLDQKEKATAYLSKFAKLIRFVLEASKSNVIACWKDIETIELYLQLESLRFDNKFSYVIDADENILNGDYKVPPLVIQPFVENAIHHGLLNKIDADKKLLIKITASDNSIHYMIEDNGVGRTTADNYKKLNKPAHESMGMQISIDRIHLFNHHNNGSVKVTDLVDEQKQPTGTRVDITLMNHP